MSGVLLRWFSGEPVRTVLSIRAGRPSAYLLLEGGSSVSLRFFLFLVLDKSFERGVTEDWVMLVLITPNKSNTERKETVSSTYTVQESNDRLVSLTGLNMVVGIIN